MSQAKDGGDDEVIDIMNGALACFVEQPMQGRELGSMMAAVPRSGEPIEVAGFVETAFRFR